MTLFANRYGNYVFLALGLFVCAKVFYRHGNGILQYLEQSVLMMIH
jgi:hypothetical protein